MDNTRWAAIDVGSNAIRMVIADYSIDGFEVLKKYRVPIRLGADVFEKGKISGKNFKASARAFRQFAEVCAKLKVKRVRGVATSALREAKNGKSFVELIFRRSQIRIEIIDGVEEAQLIHLAVRKEVHLEGNRCLLIDVGGGSVELTFSENAQMTATQSFPFGTVRTLEAMKRKKLKESSIGLLIGEYLEPLSHFIHSQINHAPLDFAIGTGGNLEAMAKLKTLLLHKESRNSLNSRELSEIIERLALIPPNERINALGMRPDRADVIFPAAILVQATMRQAGVNKLIIPEVGLKDGVLWSLVSGGLNLLPENVLGLAAKEVPRSLEQTKKSSQSPNIKPHSSSTLKRSH